MDTYVYGVVRKGAATESPPPGIDGKGVRTVASGNLAALASDAESVPVKGNRRNLLAHADVLQRTIESVCVLPMQFGVVLPSDDAVKHELLDAYADGLMSQLEAFDPYVELDVRALCPEDGMLRAVVAERSDIRQLRDSLEGQPPEATYAERIRLGELVSQAVSLKGEQVAARVETTLAPLAASTAVGETLHEQMLANVAFLVERARIGEFDAAVSRLGDELGEPIRLRYMGPLPAFNFIDVDIQEAAWA